MDLQFATTTTTSAASLILARSLPLHRFVTALLPCAFFGSLQTLVRLHLTPLCSHLGRLDPPDTLAYQVTFRYFTDWIRESQPALADNPEALDAAWLQYKSDFMRKGHAAFFDEMKDKSWFREKYEPSKEMEEMREGLKVRGRAGAMERFLKEVESGKLDALSFDYGACFASGTARRKGCLS
jgi:hypothetical protein